MREPAALLALAMLAGLAACGSPSAQARDSEVEAAIAALERDVPLPDATLALDSYDRYYSVSPGRIEAVYLRSQTGAGRVHVVERDSAPKPKAGGCSVVNIAFDRASNRFDRVLCNGVRLSDAAPALRSPTRPPSRGERG